MKEGHSVPRTNLGLVPRQSDIGQVQDQAQAAQPKNKY